MDASCEQQRLLQQVTCSDRYGIERQLAEFLVSIWDESSSSRARRPGQHQQMGNFRDMIPVLEHQHQMVQSTVANITQETAGNPMAGM